MKMRAILGALVLATLPAMPVWAENMTPEEIKKLVDEAVEQRLQERERREGPPVEPREENASTEPAAEPGVGPLPEVAGIFAPKSGYLCPSAQPDPVDCCMRNRSYPFPKAIVGGYIDIQYRMHQHSVLETGDYTDIRGGQGTSNGFDPQRFVPFIYADITEHVKFASELEIEHGIRETNDNEVSVEFAHSSTTWYMKASTYEQASSSSPSASLTCCTIRR